jgi:hypothetical protein
MKGLVLLVATATCVYAHKQIIENDVVQNTGGVKSDVDLS